MKTLALMVVVLVLSGCATLKGVEMTEDERKLCEAEGCTVWTVQELQALVREAMQRGYLAGQKQKGSI